MPETSDLSARDARLLAELSADIGVEHVADVYAKALLGAAEKTGDAAAVLDELDALITDVLEQFPKFEAVLGSPLVSSEEKSDLLDRLFNGRVSTTLMNALKVIARHGRLDCLRVIYGQARRLYDKRQGRVRVRLTTATPIDEALSRKLNKTLREALGGEPIVTHVVDPDVIGGAVLRVGDTVYDGSIAQQLSHIRQQMMDRSAHEIQSRRDRFRYPAGN
jgi:F-type H+-transporting ATPase subunit delta